MILDLFQLVIYDNNWFYSLILMFIISSFLSSLFFVFTKGYRIFKNNYYTYLFEKDLWNQSLEKNLDNSKKWVDRSTLVKMFSNGFTVFIGQYKNNNNYNYGSNIELTKNTMKVILKKDIEYYNNGFNLLSFNSSFIPYSILALATWEIVSIFSTVSIETISLVMFVKPLSLLFFGLLMTGVTTTLYLILKDRLETEEEKLGLFVEEFGIFLHRNFYTEEEKKVVE